MSYDIFRHQMKYLEDWRWNPFMQQKYRKLTKIKTLLFYVKCSVGYKLYSVENE